MFKIFVNLIFSIGVSLIVVGLTIFIVTSLVLTNPKGSWESYRKLKNWNQLQHI
jgi:high-affinity nickel permease